MEGSIIQGNLIGGIVQGYLFRGKSLAENYPCKNFMAAKVQGGLSRSQKSRGQLPLG